MLIESGCRPEWIALGKEIREDIADLRKSLMLKREKLGPLPFTSYNSMKWDEAVKECFSRKIIINGKIDKFNMIVPILTKQRVHIDGDKEILRVITRYGYGALEQTNMHEVDKIEKNRNTSVLAQLLSRLLLLFKFLRKFGKEKIRRF